MRSQNRTDIAQARKGLEQTDISMKYLRNQKLPALDVTANYNVIGTAGTQRVFDYSQGVIPPPILRSSQRSFGDSLGDVFANEFKTWSVVFNLSYPIGTSAADAGLAQARLQRDQQTTNLRDLETIIVAQVRDAARQVTTALKRVETTQKARAARRAEPAGVREAPRRRLVGHVPRDPGPARPDDSVEQRTGRDHRLQPGAD